MSIPVTTALELQLKHQSLVKAATEVPLKVILNFVRDFQGNSF